jgi:hypothetical protein
VFNTLRSIKGAAIVLGFVVAAVQAVVHFYRGDYILGLQEFAKFIYSLAVLPAAIFDALECIFVWFCPSLVQNKPWKLLVMLNPARHGRVVIDVVFTAFSLAVLAWQHSHAELNAALNELADRIEKEMGVFTHSWGVALSTFTKWLSEKLGYPIPEWAVNLIEYYRNNRPTEFAINRTGLPFAHSVA